jgi:hypothetical protein
VVLGERAKLDAGGGNILAFFELPNSPPMGRDEATPAWVQHIAFKVDSVQELEQTKARLQAAGIDVVGVTDHTIFKSIYFFDPNGHRLELAADTATPEMMQRLDDVKWAMLEEWSRTKRAPKHAAWMHEREFSSHGGADLSDGARQHAVHLHLPRVPLPPSRRAGDGVVLRHPVVVVGAGPIGLTAALDCAARGMPVVVLDDNNTVSIGSRAVCYAKRPLEIWDRLGVGEGFVDEA